MLLNNNLRTAVVLTSKMQIIGCHFLLYLTQFFINFYEILENRKDIYQILFKKHNFLKFGFADFIFYVPKILNFFYHIS